MSWKVSLNSQYIHLLFQKCKCSILGRFWKVHYFGTFLKSPLLLHLHFWNGRGLSCEQSETRNRNRRNRNRNRKSHICKQALNLTWNMPYWTYYHNFLTFISISMSLIIRQSHIGKQEMNLLVETCYLKFCNLA